MDVFLSLAGNAARARLFARALVLCLCVGACSHLDPYESPAQQNAAPDDNRRILAPAPIAAPDYRDTRYVSTMHEQLERVDEHRVRLQAIIGRIGSERDLYDAALWLTVPLVAFSPAPKDVTRAAAVLGAGYAYLATRPKEQVPLLEDAIGRLTCLMVDYSPYLYTNKDFGEFGPDGHHSRRHADLLAAIREFEERTGEFIASVPVRATKMSDEYCAVLDSEDCDVRRKRRARIEVPGNIGQITLYRSQVRERIDEAEREAGELAALEDRILRSAPDHLMLSAHRIMEDTGRRLRAAQPPPVSFGALVDGQPAAQPGTGAAIDAQSRNRTRRFDTGLPELGERSKESRALREQAAAAGRTLAAARRAARAFMNAHEERIAASASVAQTYCAPSPAAATPLTSTPGRAPGRLLPHEEPLGRGP